MFLSAWTLCSAPSCCTIRAKNYWNTATSYVDSLQRLRCSLFQSSRSSQSYLCGLLTLTHQQDTVAIHPSHFGVPPEQALISEINKKYANRVLHDVGLCICVFDLVEAGEGKVRYGDGFLWYKGMSDRHLHYFSPLIILQLYSGWSFFDHLPRRSFWPE